MVFRGATYEKAVVGDFVGGAGPTGDFVGDEIGDFVGDEVGGEVGFFVDFVGSTVVGGVCTRLLFVRIAT